MAPVGSELAREEELDRRSTTVEVSRPVPTGRWTRRIVVDATLAHGVESVFPYLADPLRWHDFAPAVEFREQIDPGAPHVGTRWRGTDRIGPFRIHFVDTLDELDENRRVVWLSSAPWNSRVEYACAASGSHTHVHAEYEGDLGDSLKWQVGWLPVWAWHRILARDFVRLDRLLGERARASERWMLQHWPVADESSGRSAR